MSAFGVTRRLSISIGAPVLVVERAVAGDGRGVLGEGAEADLALQSLRRADLAEQHAVLVVRQGYSSAGCSAWRPRPRLGSGLLGRRRGRRRQQLRRRPALPRRRPWPSPRRRSSWPPRARGASCRAGPCSGSSRASRFRMPATSRKRSTRSVGCAPTPSQCLTRSSTSLTRSAEPWAGADRRCRSSRYSGRRAGSANRRRRCGNRAASWRRPAPV